MLNSEESGISTALSLTLLEEIKQGKVTFMAAISNFIFLTHTRGLVKQDSIQQSCSSYHSPSIQTTQGGKGVMEIEGRCFSDIYRNSSEELFLKSLMDGSIGLPVPTMEMLGFKNLHHNLRTDSEELFKTWLTNGESHGHNSASIPYRTRQASRRLSTELCNLSSQHADTLQTKNRDILPAHGSLLAEETSGEHGQQTTRTAVERGMQASNLYLAKAWFQSSQPMTRSRSSELRKKYAAMQTTQTAFGIEAMHSASGVGINNSKQEFASPNGFVDLIVCENANQLDTFMSPSNSSSYNASEIGNVDRVSSVVSMLKGTLERKKLHTQVEKETVENSSDGIIYQGVIGNLSFDKAQETNNDGIVETFHQIPSCEVQDIGFMQTVHRSMDLDMQGFVNPMNPIQLAAVSREPSQSESSAAAPVVSSGFDVCDGPSNSSQTISICESPRKQVTKSSNTENYSKAKDFRVQMIDNLKDDRKRGGLVRYGSVTSAGSGEKGESTKKRRVERFRKMAEAKERNLTPVVPSDMQAILKRCENLEKEVRSLKLNLSFMNRKDSEQTKQMEELQKQNDDLADEKERLLEEIERIISETGKM